MSAMVSQIAGVSIVYSTVCSGADQRKHQSSSSLDFVRGIQRWLVKSPQKASNAENVSIWWRHHDACAFVYAVRSSLEHFHWYELIVYWWKWQDYLPIPGHKKDTPPPPPPPPTQHAHLSQHSDIDDAIFQGRFERMDRAWKKSIHGKIFLGKWCVLDLWNSMGPRSSNRW